MYRVLYDKLIFPVYHALQGDRANTAIRSMDRHDAITPEEMLRVESGKLLRLLMHASASVPYYRDLFLGAGLLGGNGCDESRFAMLPLLTKDIIRKEFDRLVSSDLSDNRIDPNSTSGSSGSPLSFYTDLRSKCFRKGAVTRNRKWIGIRRGDPIVHLWGSPIDADKASALRGKLHGLVTRELFLSAYHLRDEDMLDYAGRIRKFRPRLLVGYPSILQAFGTFCVSRGISFPSLRAIVCSAESLFDDQRDRIERFFSVPVYNRYGCREVGDIAHEVPGVRGLVVNSDRVLVEILDYEGRSCAPGETGEIVITDLDNYGMPLIRYRIGDRGAWSDVEGRKKGLPYPVLKLVEGRVLDVVVTPDGNHIGGTYWTILFRQRPGIAIFQVVQRRVDGVNVRYVRADGVTHVDERYFREKIQELCGAAFNVEFEVVDSIAPDATGKFRIVVSEVSGVAPAATQSGIGR